MAYFQAILLASCLARSMAVDLAKFELAVQINSVMVYLANLLGSFLDLFLPM